MIYNINMMRKTAQIDNMQFLLPFSVNGFWVVDARGTPVCECRNMQIAKAIAKLLNAEHGE